MVGQEHHQKRRISQSTTVSIQEPDNGSGRTILPASRFRYRLRLSEPRGQRGQLSIVVLQRQGSTQPKTHNQRRRSLRPLFVLSAGTGKSRNGAVGNEESLPPSHGFSGLQLLGAALLLCI